MIPAVTSISGTYNIKNSTISKDADPRRRSSYVTSCQICQWDGYPHQRIVVEIEGFRPEEENGLLYKFTEYDYAPGQQCKRKHIHVFNRILKEPNDKVSKN